MRERVEASVPFVRFRVERELSRGDLESAEGKDARRRRAAAGVRVGAGERAAR